MIMPEETEKIFVIPLKIKGYSSSKAAPIAMKRVKLFLMKHMKTTQENIWIDESLNNKIWNQGKFKMPSKIRVKAVKFEDGVVEAYLPDLTFEKSRRELIMEEKLKKQPILRKEEESEEEPETSESGTEDIEVVPTADGDVKIKKKKQPKEESEEKETPEKKKESQDETIKEQKEKEPSTKKEKTAKETVEKKVNKAPKEKTEKPSE